MTSIRNYLSVLTIAAVFSMNAQEYEYGIIISKTDGNRDYVRFSESPKIIFNENDEIVFSTDKSSIIYRINDIDGYSFGDVPFGELSSVAKIDAYVLNFTVDKNMIVVNNITEQSHVSIYSMAGVEMYNRMAADSKDLVIDISRYEPGIYILTVDNVHTLKFNKQ